MKQIRFWLDDSTPNRSPGGFSLPPMRTAGWGSWLDAEAVDGANSARLLITWPSGTREVRPTEGLRFQYRDKPAPANDLYSYLGALAPNEFVYSTMPFPFSGLTNWSMAPSYDPSLDNVAAFLSGLGKPEEHFHSCLTGGHRRGRKDSVCTCECGATRDRTGEEPGPWIEAPHEHKCSITDWKHIQTDKTPCRCECGATQAEGKRGWAEPVKADEEADGVPQAELCLWCTTALAYALPCLCELKREPCGFIDCMAKPRSKSRVMDEISRGLEPRGVREPDQIWTVEPVAELAHGYCGRIAAHAEHDYETTEGAKLLCFGRQELHAALKDHPSESNARSDPSGAS